MGIKDISKTILQEKEGIYYGSEGGYFYMVVKGVWAGNTVINKIRDIHILLDKEKT